MSDENLRILLAEDNPSNAELIRYIVQRLGHCLEVVSDGQMALEHCLHQEYDIVLMDLQMPVMDGLEATRRIRASSDYNRDQLGIVALSAANITEYQPNGSIPGIDAYISKPFQIAEIEKSIQKVTQARQRL
jgi:CheY-like chemotaxis protein